LDKSKFTHEVALRFSDTDKDGTLFEKYVKILYTNTTTSTTIALGDVSLQEWDRARKQPAAAN
tara:strand:- start:276 stop:464 length:189 start_codon:yes stop_codon:yes gene_type:complete